MPLKYIYRWLGPLYYDFMGFDMGFLFSVFILSYSFLAQRDQIKGSLKMLRVFGQIFSVYVLILAHTFTQPTEHVCLCFRASVPAAQQQFRWVCSRDAASLPFPSAR